MERELEQMPSVDDFQTVADIFKQLGDGSRIRIFWLLCHCEECVINLSSMVEMSSPAVSHHLKQLKAGGLIVSRREGKEVYYKAAETEQAQLLHHMIEAIWWRSPAPRREVGRSGGMKQADCLRMALAELPQGTMEIVGRPAAEPGVLFTGTFQARDGWTGTDGGLPGLSGGGGVLQHGPGHLGRLPARGGPVRAGDQPLPPGPGGLGPAGRHVGLSGGRAICRLHSADCCADSVMHFPGGDVREG